jgi:hypothetical protein
MFTRAQLLEVFDQGTSAPLPWTLKERSPEDFESASSEESLVVAIFSDARDVSKPFWIQFVKGSAWNGDKQLLRFVLEQALCEPMTEQEFRMASEITHGPVRWPIAIILPTTGFLWAMRMYDEWDEQAYLARFEDALVAVYWSTSA